MVAGDDRTALALSLSPGHSGDAPEGRELLRCFSGKGCKDLPVMMDRAYDGDETRQVTLDLMIEPVVLPKRNRLNPWVYDKQMYKKATKLKDCSQA